MPTGRSSRPIPPLLNLRGVWSSRTPRYSLQPLSSMSSNAMISSTLAMLSPAAPVEDVAQVRQRDPAGILIVIGVREGGSRLACDPRPGGNEGIGDCDQNAPIVGDAALQVLRQFRIEVELGLAARPPRHEAIDDVDALHCLAVASVKALEIAAGGLLHVDDDRALQQRQRQATDTANRHRCEG